MKVSDLLDSIVQLQTDNPDKIGNVLALYGAKPSTVESFVEDSSAVILKSKNPIFTDSEDTIELLKLPTHSFNFYDSSSSFRAVTSSYNRYSTSNSITNYTNNFNKSETNNIFSLFNVLKEESGILSSSLSVQNEVFFIKFDTDKLDTLISCSLSTDPTILQQGRIEFAKQMVSWINDKIKEQNKFYYYAPKNISLNYSDDDGVDETYAQLKTENVYNYFDSNYELESRLVDEKVLPGILHQVMLYRPTRDILSGKFSTPEIPKHFAAKQIFGSDLEAYFTSNNASDPNINSFNYTSYESGSYFNRNLYSNWSASKHTKGSYVHPNDYRVIDDTRTKLNNLNLHIELTNPSDVNYVSGAQNSLEPYIPYYSKVSFGIPKQKWNLFSDEASTKTIVGALINNLYVNGDILDEQKLMVDDEYTTTLVNINLLKFFNDYYNTSNETNTRECEEPVSKKKGPKSIGLTTNALDEIYASIGYRSSVNSTYSNLPLNKNVSHSYFETFTNILQTENKSTFKFHLTPSEADSYYSLFLASRTPTDSKFYFMTKIAKYFVADDGSETLVQNFYFDLRNEILNRTPDASSFADATYTFFDNQIHTNKRYNYKISQLIIVPALAYGYTTADAVQKDGDLQLQIGVSYVPTYKLIEVPIQSQSDIVVLEHPPVRPQIQFYPILNNRNKLLIQINPSGFDETAEPVIIEDLDINLFDKILESQNSTGSVQFTSDPDESGIDKYEIYRLETYPSSYKSFSNKKIAQINNVGDSNYSFYDSVKVNTPYYYCVRAKNVRGLPSNPTSVFKVILVEDGEFFTLQQEIIENLNNENIYTRSSVKEIKRFLHISPSEIQKNTSASVDGNASDAATNFELTSVNEQVWGKRFKIRVRSKSSGKTIDFNIRFNKNNSGEYIPE